MPGLAGFPVVPAGHSRGQQAVAGWPAPAMDASIAVLVVAPVGVAGKSRLVLRLEAPSTEPIPGPGSGAGWPVA